MIFESVFIILFSRIVLSSLLGSPTLYTSIFSDTSSLSSDLQLWSASSSYCSSSTNPCYAINPTTCLFKCPSCGKMCQNKMNFTITGHYQAGIAANFYLLGSAQGNQWYTIFAEGQEFGRGQLLVNTTNTSTCPIAFVNLTVPHNSTNLEIMIEREIYLAWSALQIYIYRCAYSTCLNCTNDTQCETCIDNALLTSDGICLCTPGRYESVNSSCDYTEPCSSCEFCNRTCQTCQNNLTCASCYANAFLNPQTTQCECTPGRWMNTNWTCDYTLGDCSHCEVCDDACQECTMAGQCSACYFGASLTKDFQCQCGEGFYLDEARDCPVKTCTLCQLCDVTCKSCSGPAASQCLSCNDLFVLTTDGFCVTVIGFFLFKCFFIKGCLEEENQIQILNGSQIFELEMGYFFGNITKMTCLDPVSKEILVSNTKSFFFYENCSMERPHFQLGLEFELYKLGAFDSGSLYIYDGESSLLLLNTTFYFTLGGLNCGSFIQNNSDSQSLSLNFPHNSQIINLTIEVSLQPQEKVLQWGIDSFSLTKLACNETCRTCQNFTSNDCLSCSDQNSVLLSNGQCACKSGFYMEIFAGINSFPSSVCAKCYKTCLTCGGGSEKQCLTCYKGDTLANNTCVATNSFPIEVNLTYNSSTIESWSLLSHYTPLSVTSNCSEAFFPGFVLDSVVSSIFNLTATPPHYALSLSFTFEKIEGLQYDPSFILFLDNTSYPFGFDYYRKDFCDGLSIHTYEVSQYLLHSNLYFNLSIAGFSNQSTFDWRIRNLDIDIFTCDESCLECSQQGDSNCITCFPFAEFVGSGKCQCLTGFYPLNSVCNGEFDCITCSMCDFSCLNCNASGSDHCLSCSSGFYFNASGFCVKNFSQINPSLANLADNSYEIASDLGGTYFTSGDIQGFEIMTLGTPISRRLLQTQPTSSFTNITLSNVKNCESFFDIVGGETFFGNNSLIVTKVYPELSPHFALEVHLRVFKFIVVSFYENISLLLDGVQVYQINSGNSQNYTENFCVSRETIQDPTAQQIKTFFNSIDVFINHTNANLNLSLLSQKDALSSGENWGFREIVILTLLCHNSCASCFGNQPIQCSSCNFQTNGLLFYENSCIAACPSGFVANFNESVCDFAVTCGLSEASYLGNCVLECPQHYVKQYDSVSNMYLCQICDASCLNCSGPANTDCTSCYPGNYFFNNTSSMCLVCNSSLCKSCHGNSVSQCDECVNASVILFDGDCLLSCPSGFYFSESDNTCEKCDHSCKKCDGATQFDCTECPRTQFFTPFSACKSSCDIGYYPVYNICKPCNESCLGCSGPTENECTSCQNIFELNKQTCILKRAVNVTVEAPDNPNSFNLIFNEILPGFFQQASYYIHLKIDNFENSFFQYTFNQASDNTSILMITLTFFKNFTNISKFLHIEINQYAGDFPMYLSEQTLEIALKTMMICDLTDFYYEESSKECILRENAPTKIYVKPTADPTNFYILVNNGNISIYRNILKYTSITISGLSTLDFSYNISQDAIQTNTFQVLLSYFVNITGQPILQVSFNFPPNFIQSYNHDIIIQNYEFSLDDYYELSAADKAVLETSRKINTAGGPSYSTGLLVSLVAFPTAGPLKILMLNKMVSNLMFLDISYPLLMRDLFMLKSANMPILLINFENPDENIFVNVDESTIGPEDDRYTNDLFTKYGVKLYFISNFGDKIVQVLIIFGFAHLLVFIQRLVFRYAKLVKILDVLHSIFVWGWLLSFITSNIQIIVFYLCRSWYFAKYTTTIGKVDLIVSIIVILLIFITFVYIFKINLKLLRKSTEKKKKKELWVKSKSALKNKHIEEQSEPYQSDPENSSKSFPANENVGLASPITKEPCQEEDRILEPHLKKNESENTAKLDPKERKQSSFKMNASEMMGQIDQAIGELEKRYKIFIKEIKRENFMTLNYIFFEMGKFSIHSIIIVAFYQQAFLQIILLFSTTFYFILYLFVYRPFKSKFKLWVCIAQEIICLFAFSNVCILAYYDLIANYDITERDALARYFGTANWMLFGLFFLGIGKNVWQGIQKKVHQIRVKKRGISVLKK